MRVIAIYAERLTRRGHEVSVVMPRRKAPNLRDRVQALVKRGIWLSQGDENRLSFFRGGRFEVRCTDHPGPVTDQDLPDADVLIATWWETAEWVWAASKSKGSKLHFMQDYETWAAPVGDVARVDAIVALPIPKIVIAQWVTDLLKRQWAQTPVALVPNSVQTDLFFAPPRGKQATPTVGFAYSSLINKGCDVICAAIERSRQHLPKLRVIAFSQNRPTAEIPLPAGTEFHFRAKDEELRDLYAASDAWLFGTRIEGFGLPILEAMACRTPVIGTPAGAAPKLIGQGGGILVPMEDVAAMSEAIVRIAAMADTEWRTMSNAAYRTATSYTWDDAADQFEAAVMRAAQR
jgi:glycosyltransferase involved in cell wall biosynthesis